MEMNTKMILTLQNGTLGILKVVSALSVYLLVHGAANAQSVESTVVRKSLLQPAMEIQAAGVDQFFALSSDRRRINLENFRDEESILVFQTDEDIVAFASYIRPGLTTKKPLEIGILYRTSNGLEVTYLVPNLEGRKFEPLSPPAHEFQGLVNPSLAFLPSSALVVWQRELVGRDSWYVVKEDEVISALGKLRPSEFAGVGVRDTVLGFHAESQTLSVTDAKSGEVYDTVFAEFLESYSPETTSIFVPIAERGGNGTVIYVDSAYSKTGVLAVLNLLEGSVLRISTPLIAGLSSDYSGSEPLVASNIDSTLILVGKVGSESLDAWRQVEKRLEKISTVDLPFPIRSMVVNSNLDDDTNEYEEELLLLSFDGIETLSVSMSDLLTRGAIGTNSQPLGRELKPLDPHGVVAIQKALQNLGFETGPADGLIGPRTIESIKGFQLDIGMPNNGIEGNSIDYRTYVELMRRAGKNDGLENAVPKFPSGPFSEGDYIRLQRILGVLGFSIGAVDGKLGSATNLALRRFQLSSDLPTTGIVNGGVDEATRIALEAIARRIGSGDQTTSQPSPESGEALNYREDFSRFIASKVPGFDSDRLLLLGRSHESLNSACFGVNSLPPRSLWHQILPIARAVHRVESFYGPVLIHSAYRNQAYSNCIKGSSRSNHTQFNALDVAPVSQRQGEIKNLSDEFESLRDSGFFHGGIGIQNTFLHIDARGLNASWDNRIGGSQSE